MSVALFQSRCENCDSPVYARMENPYDLVASCRCETRNMAEKVIRDAPRKKCDAPYVSYMVIRTDDDF